MSHEREECSARVFMGPSQGSSNSLLKGFHPFQLPKIAARYPNAATVGF